MGLDKDNALSRDNFGGFFFHTYWNIIQNDVLSIVLQFFRERWIIPNYNSNLMVLIPKVSNSDSIELYMLMSLANFKHKIVTKIIVVKLSTLFPFIISPKQRASFPVEILNIV